MLKKKDSLIFPGEESAPDWLHQLTPNSILHISLFITLCECFLGTHPHWGLWKRIFYLRRNNSRSVVYNVGGVCICVRPDIDYFYVKFPDSVQGWRKRWLYIQDETIGNQEYDIAPFDGAAKIIRRRSLDAEASVEEKTATDALMKRIHQLKNTHGEELLGIQITAYFLRIRVQPLQARKTPLWLYAGEEDVDRISKELSMKDLEKLIRRFSSLSKKHEVPTSCRVEPYIGSHALPENHQVLTSLPPLPEGREMDERVVITDDSQESAHLESEVAASTKSAASSEKGTDSEPSESGRTTSPPPAVSPRNERKRDDCKDSGTSKPAGSPAEEKSPEEEGTFCPYEDAGSVSSTGEGEEEGPTILGTAPTSTSNTVVLSEENRTAADSSPPRQQIMNTSTPSSSPRAPSPKRIKTGAGDEQMLIMGSSSTPMLNDLLMDRFIRLGSQSIGFRNEANTLKASLQQAEEHAEALEAKLKLSEEAREKAESDAACVEDLRQRLAKAETALSDKIAEQIKREQGIIDRLEAQSRRFFQNLKTGVEGTIALVANSCQQVDWAKAGDAGKINKDKWKALVSRVLLGNALR
ncbi:hypothetical protein QYE76_010929 [Lolium multiflorum]|uniref:Transposase (putative) gypsy type domain-containing protein n=1 Tax=Lolium multiflorum TaxID=4521 RepID=A0AAD8X4T9_LOLMU|nr:hypothetical protein QYE76_010929 [Lolium multiflorum]